MKITKIETIYSDRYLFVQVHTDEGLVGLGESGAWAYLEASGAAVEKISEYLLGRDPLTIEHHWQYLYHGHHFRGAAIYGAFSAIDIALWDIAGQFYGVPIYKLLGGMVRHKVRTYFHVKGDTEEKLIQGCKDAKAEGFTAVGHLNPLMDESIDSPHFMTHAQKMGKITDRVGKFRDAVGDEVDLCIEMHRRLTLPEAIDVCERLKQFSPMFIEDPIPPHNFDAMAQIAATTTVPIATGERLLSPKEFAMLVKADAVQYLRPCVCLCGGITGAMKVAAMAEAFDLFVVPHNPLGPVSTAACVHVATAINNLGIQEYNQIEAGTPAGQLFDATIKMENGYLLPPERAGLGIALKRDVADQIPYNGAKPQARLSVDGSIISH